MILIASRVAFLSGVRWSSSLTLNCSVKRSSICWESSMSSPLRVIQGHKPLAPKGFWMSVTYLIPAKRIKHSTFKTYGLILGQYLPRQNWWRTTTSLPAAFQSALNLANFLFSKNFFTEIITPNPMHITMLFLIHSFDQSVSRESFTNMSIVAIPFGTSASNTSSLTVQLGAFPPKWGSKCKCTYEHINTYR